MKTRMIKRKGTLLSSVAVLGTAMLLTACGGDGGDSPVDDGGANPGESGAQALLYAYPDNGQGEISTAAPVVLRFSSAVNLGQAQNSITLYEGDAETGTVVNTTPAVTAAIHLSTISAATRARATIKRCSTPIPITARAKSPPPRRWYCASPAP